MKVKQGVANAAHHGVTNAHQFVAPIQRKIFMKITTLVLAVSLCAGGGLSVAQETSDAEVRKVDKDSNRLVLKHGEIKNLDMPDMIMVFRVKDPHMLDTVKPGDKIKFKAEKLDGVYTVTFIELAK